MTLEDLLDQKAPIEYEEELYHAYCYQGEWYYTNADMETLARNLLESHYPHFIEREIPRIRDKYAKEEILLSVEEEKEQAIEQILPDFLIGDIFLERVTKNCKVYPLYFFEQLVEDYYYGDVLQESEKVLEEEYE